MAVKAYMYYITEGKKVVEIQRSSETFLISYDDDTRQYYVDHGTFKDYYVCAEEELYTEYNDLGDIECAYFWISCDKDDEYVEKVTEKNVNCYIEDELYHARLQITHYALRLEKLNMYKEKGLICRCIAYKENRRKD